VAGGTAHVLNSCVRIMDRRIKIESCAWRLVIRLHLQPPVAQLKHSLRRKLREKKNDKKREPFVWNFLLLFNAEAVTGSINPTSGLGQP
jgi:hypothetical protein